MAYDVTKLVNLGAAKTLMEKINSEIGGISVPEYTIAKQASAESGYLATYYLTKNGTQVGEKINIPKDYLVKSAEIKTCSTAGQPAAGYKAGDKYIDFVINSAGGDGNESHVYLLVSDLVDTYTAGNGISISSANAVAIKLDSSNANGLAVTASGLKLTAATDSAPGAMSAADHTKLGGVAAGATKVQSSTTNGKIKINGTETTVYTLPSDVIQGAIATDTEVTEMLNEVFGI